MHIALQMDKQEVLNLLATAGSPEAGAVISFVEEVPPEDAGFQWPWGSADAALVYWLAKMNKCSTQGKFLPHTTDLFMAVGRADIAKAMDSSTQGLNTTSACRGARRVEGRWEAALGTRKRWQGAGVLGSDAGRRITS